MAGDSRVINFDGNTSGLLAKLDKLVSKSEQVETKAKSLGRTLDNLGSKSGIDKYAQKMFLAFQKAGNSALIAANKVKQMNSLFNNQKNRSIFSKSDSDLIDTMGNMLKTAKGNLRNKNFDLVGQNANTLAKYANLYTVRGGVIGEKNSQLMSALGGSKLDLKILQQLVETANSAQNKLGDFSLNNLQAVFENFNTLASQNLDLSPILARAQTQTQSAATNMNNTFKELLDQMLSVLKQGLKIFKPNKQQKANIRDRKKYLLEYLNALDARGKAVPGQNIYQKEDTKDVILNRLKLYYALGGNKKLNNIRTNLKLNDNAGDITLKLGALSFDVQSEQYYNQILNERKLLLADIERLQQKASYTSQNTKQQEDLLKAQKLLILARRTAQKYTTNPSYNRNPINIKSRDSEIENLLNGSFKGSKYTPNLNALSSTIDRFFQLKMDDLYSQLLNGVSVDDILAKFKASFSEKITGSGADALAKHGHLLAYIDFLRGLGGFSLDLIFSGFKGNINERFGQWDALLRINQLVELLHEAQEGLRQHLTEVSSLLISRMSDLLDSLLKKAQSVRQANSLILSSENKTDVQSVKDQLDALQSIYKSLSDMQNNYEESPMQEGLLEKNQKFGLIDNILDNLSVEKLKLTQLRDGLLQQEQLTQDITTINEAITNLQNEKEADKYGYNASTYKASKQESGSYGVNRSGIVSAIKQLSLLIAGFLKIQNIINKSKSGKAGLLDVNALVLDPSAAINKYKNDIIELIPILELLTEKELQANDSMELSTKKSIKNANLNIYKLFLKNNQISSLLTVDKLRKQASPDQKTAYDILLKYADQLGLRSYSKDYKIGLIKNLIPILEGKVSGKSGLLFEKEYEQAILSLKRFGLGLFKNVDMIDSMSAQDILNHIQSPTFGKTNHDLLAELITPYMRDYDTVTGMTVKTSLDAQQKITIFQNLIDKLQEVKAKYRELGVGANDSGFAQINKTITTLSKSVENLKVKFNELQIVLGKAAPAEVQNLIQANADKIKLLSKSLQGYGEAQKLIEKINGLGGKTITASGLRGMLLKYKEGGMQDQGIKALLQTLVLANKTGNLTYVDDLGKKFSRTFLGMISNSANGVGAKGYKLLSLHINSILSKILAAKLAIALMKSLGLNAFGDFSGMNADALFAAINSDSFNEGVQSAKIAGITALIQKLRDALNDVITLQQQANQLISTPLDNTQSSSILSQIVSLELLRAKAEEVRDVLSSSTVEGADSGFNTMDAVIQNIISRITQLGETYRQSTSLVDLMVSKFHLLSAEADNASKITARYTTGQKKNTATSSDLQAQIDSEKELLKQFESLKEQFSTSSNKDLLNANGFTLIENIIKRINDEVSTLTTKLQAVSLALKTALLAAQAKATSRGSRTKTTSTGSTRTTTSPGYFSSLSEDASGLTDVLDEITQAINRKTQAFGVLSSVVSEVVAALIAALNRLYDSIKRISDSLSGKDNSAFVENLRSLVKINIKDGADVKIKGLADALLELGIALMTIDEKGAINLDKLSALFSTAKDLGGIKLATQSLVAANKVASGGLRSPLDKYLAATNALERYKLAYTELLAIQREGREKGYESGAGNMPAPPDYIKRYLHLSSTVTGLRESFLSLTDDPQVMQLFGKGFDADSLIQKALQWATANLTIISSLNRLKLALAERAKALLNLVKNGDKNADIAGYQKLKDAVDQARTKVRQISNEIRSAFGSQKREPGDINPNEIISNTIGDAGKASKNAIQNQIIQYQKQARKELDAVIKKYGLNENDNRIRSLMGSIYGSGTQSGISDLTSKNVVSSNIALFAKGLLERKKALEDYGTAVKKLSDLKLQQSTTDQKLNPQQYALLTELINKQYQAVQNLADAYVQLRGSSRQTNRDLQKTYRDNSKGQLAKGADIIKGYQDKARLALQSIKDKYGLKDSDARISNLLSKILYGIKDKTSATKVDDLISKFAARLQAKLDASNKNKTQMANVLAQYKKEEGELANLQKTLASTSKIDNPQQYNKLESAIANVTARVASLAALYRNLAVSKREADATLASEKAKAGEKTKLSLLQQIAGYKDLANLYLKKQGVTATSGLTNSINNISGLTDLQNIKSQIDSIKSGMEAPKNALLAYGKAVENLATAQLKLDAINQNTTPEKWSLQKAVVDALSASVRVAADDYRSLTTNITEAAAAMNKQNADATARAANNYKGKTVTDFKDQMTKQLMNMVSKFNINDISSLLNNSDVISSGVINQITGMRNASDITAVQAKIRLLQYTLSHASNARISQMGAMSTKLFTLLGQLQGIKDVTQLTSEQSARLDLLIEKWNKYSSVVNMTTGTVIPTVGATNRLLLAQAKLQLNITLMNEARDRSRIDTTAWGNDPTIQRYQQMLDIIESKNIAGMGPIIDSAREKMRLLNTLFAKTGDILKYTQNASKLVNSLSNIYQVMPKDTDKATGVAAAQQLIMNRSGGKATNMQQQTDSSGITSVTAQYKDQTNVIHTLIASYNELNGAVSITLGTVKQGASALQTFVLGVTARARNLVEYFATFVSFYRVVGVIKKGVSAVKLFDTALTEMRKVSDESTNSLKNFQTLSFGIALSVGTTALQIQQSTALFMRLGQSLNLAAQSAANANILFNVSLFDSIGSATESLIAMSQAFKDVEQTDIIDSLNKVGNDFSISTSGLSEALQRSASALTTSGNDLAESIAMITAANTVVQDPLSVGAGMKIISLRLSGQKQQLEELGELTLGMVTTVSKLQSGIMNATKVASNGMAGINIEDANGNLKSTYLILSLIANIWDEIGANDKLNGTNQQQYLLLTMAGKNRSNILASLLQSPEILNNAYKLAQDAEGSAEIENQKYKLSILGRIKQFQNQAQELAATLLLSDLIKFFVDLGTGALEAINNITTALGGLGTALATVGSISLIKGLLKGNAISKLLEAINSAVPKVKSVITNIAGNVFGEVDPSRTMTAALSSQVNSAAAQAASFINASGAFSTDQVRAMTLSLRASGDAARVAYAEAIELQMGINSVSASAGAASISFSTLGKAIKAAFLSNPIGMGIALASTFLSVVLSITNAIKKNKQEQIKSASDSAQAYKDSSKTILLSIDKYKELKESLQSGKITLEQAAQTKSNLLEIQKQLTLEYGNQAKNIDLVNGSYDDQIARLRKINKLKAHEELLKNLATGSDAGNFSTAVEEMERQYTVDDGLVFGTYRKGDKLSDNILSLLKLYNNIKYWDYGDGNLSAYVTGTSEEIYDSMSEITKKIKEQDWYDPDSSLIKSMLTFAAKYAKDANLTISEYKDTYYKFLEMSLLDSSEKISVGGKKLFLGDYFYDYTLAILAYNNALEKGESDKIISNAKNKVLLYKKAWDEVQSDPSLSRYTKLILGLSDLINDAKDKAFDLKTALESPDSRSDKTFKARVDNLKKLNGDMLDITDFISGALGDTGVKYHGKANSVVLSAINNGWIDDDSLLSIRLLANQLAELGYLTNNTANGFDAAASSLKGFLSAAALSDPLKKLGDITDDIQSVYSSLTDAEKKFKLKSFGQSELVDLLQLFPLLALNEGFLQSVTDNLDPSGFVKYTEQIQGALSGLVFLKTVVGIEDLDALILAQQKLLLRITDKKQILAQKSAIAQMKAFRNTLVSSLDFSGISDLYVNKAISDMSISGSLAEKLQLKSWLQSQVVIGNGLIIAKLILDDDSATWGFTKWKKTVESLAVKAKILIDPEIIQEGVSGIQAALSNNSALSLAISNSIAGEFNTDSILDLINKFPLLTNNTQEFRDVVNSLDTHGVVHDTLALSRLVSGMSIDNFKDIDSYFNNLKKLAPQLESAFLALRKNIIDQADLSGITLDQLFNSEQWEKLSTNTKLHFKEMLEDGYSTEAIAKIVLKGDIDPSNIYNQIESEISRISERKYKASIQVITDFKSDISSILSVLLSILNGLVTSEDLLSLSSSMKLVSDAAYLMGASVSDMDMDGFSDDIDKWSKVLSKAKFLKLQSFLSNSNVSNVEKLSAILNTDFGNITNADDFIKDPTLKKLINNESDRQLAFKVQLAIDSTEKAETEKQIQNMFNNFLVAIKIKMTEESMSEFTANLLAMQSAIDLQYSSGNITALTLQTLTDAGINYSSMLLANASGLALNTQEATKYTLEMNHMKLSQSRVLLDMKRAELEKTLKKLSNLVGSVEDTDSALRKLDAGEAISQILEFNSLSPTQLEDITDLTNTRSELQSAIEKQKELQILILASMGLLAEMDAAASSVNPRDSLIGTLSGRELAEKTYKQGWLGDDYLGAYAQYYSGRKRKNGELITREQAIDEWEQNIEKWKPYEEYDEDNNLKATSVLKFLDESAEMTSQGIDTGIFRDLLGNIQVQVDDIRLLASAWDTSLLHVLQYLQAAEDLAPGKQFDISAMMQSWVDDLGNWDGNLDTARLDLGAFLETAQYLHKLDPSMDLTSLYSNVADKIKGMEGQLGVLDLVGLINSFSELSGITLTILLDGTITLTVNLLTQIKSIIAELLADHAVGVKIDENDERVQKLVKEYSQSELLNAGFSASNPEAGITASDIAAQFSSIMEQQNPVDKGSITLATTSITSAIQLLPSQIGESVASAIKLDGNLANEERAENISNTNYKDAPLPFDFSQYKPFNIEKMALEKFGPKQSINKELEENQGLINSTPIQTDSVTVLSSNMLIPLISEQLISKKLEENSDYSWVQEPEKAPLFKIPDYINTLKDTSIQANNVTVESGNTLIPQILPFGGVAIQLSYKTGSADTSQTPGQVAATATITGVNTSTDVVVPVTGLMDTVQNEVSLKPEVQVQGVLSQINQGDATPTVQANVQTSGGDQILQLKELASGDVSIKSSVTGNATGRLEAIKKAKDEIQSNSTANITSNVSGNAESTTSSILSNLRNLQSIGDITNTVTTVKVEKTIKQGGDAAGTFKLPAHALGTADVSLNSNEDALVNLLGTESIVRNGQWFPIPGGPHVERLKKGDIVFNKTQTDQLMRTGKASGHAKAYATGTVSGMPAHGANPYNVLKQSVSGTVTAAQQKAVNKATGNTQSTAANTQATNDNTNSKKSNTNATDKNTKKKEEEGTVVDWVAKRLDYLGNIVSNLAAKITDYISYAFRQNTLDQLLAALLKQIGDTAAGIARYNKAASEITILDNDGVSVELYPVDGKSDNKTKKTTKKKKKKSNAIGGRIFSGGKALVNELGMESRSRNGVWELLQGGPHFEDVRPDDIIFTADLTEDLLRKGKTLNYAPAFKKGKSSKKKKKSTKNKNSSKKMTKKQQNQQAAIDKYKSMIDQGYIIDLSVINDSLVATAVQNYMDYKDKVALLESQMIELENKWVDVWAEKTTAPSDEAVNRIDAYTKALGGLTDQMNALEASTTGGSTLAALDAIRGNKGRNYNVSGNDVLNAIRTGNAQKTAGAQYTLDRRRLAMQRAQGILSQFTSQYGARAESDNSKLGQAYRAILKQVQLAEEEYTNAALELAKQRVQEIKDNIDAIEDMYGAMSDWQSAVNGLRQSYINLNKARGNYENYTDYLVQAANAQKVLAIQQQESTRLHNEYVLAIAKGTLKQGTKEWYEMRAQILKVDQSILDSKADIEELNKSARKAKLEQLYERAIEKADEFIDRIEIINSLISEEMKVNIDTGDLTDFGKLSIAMDNQSMINAERDLNMYLKLRELIVARMRAQGAGDLEINDYIAQNTSNLSNAISALQSARNSILSTIKSQAKAELDALQKTIDKRKEALQKKKDYYDYDKNQKKSVKEIALLQSQVRALLNVTDALSKMRKARLEAQLQEQQEDLELTRKEHVYQLQVEGLDDLSTQLSENYDKYVNELETNLDKMTQVINDAVEGTARSVTGVYNAMTSLLGEYGISGNDLKTVFGFSGDVVGSARDVISNPNGGYTQTTSQIISSELSRAQNAKSSALKASNQQLAAEQARIAQRQKLLAEEARKRAEEEARRKAEEARRAAEEEAARRKRALLDANIASVQQNLANHQNALNQLLLAEKALEIKASKTKKKKKINLMMKQMEANMKQITAYQQAIQTIQTQLSQLQAARGYASGVRRVNLDQTAWTNENWQKNGGLIIVRKSDGAILTPLKAGDGVIPADMTQKLFGLAQNYGSIMGGMDYSNVRPINQNQNITVTYGSLLTVNGNVDEKALPGLQEILRKSYAYTVKNLSADLKKGGLRTSIH